MATCDTPTPRNKISVRCRECRKRDINTACAYYCEDCWIPLCRMCSDEHLLEKRINRHSVAKVSETFNVSPNQGPFPAFTQLSKLKLDGEHDIRCSTFLTNGALVICDYTRSKLMLYSDDYARKLQGSFILPKVYACDEQRPHPLDITAVNHFKMALTADNGKVYVVSRREKWNINLVIDVISFESNHGECLGIAFDDIDETLCIACTTDREDAHFKLYDLDGSLLRVVKDGIEETPHFLCLDVDRCRLYTANADSVIVYNPTNFDILEHFTDLAGHHRDIAVDKFGTIYVLIVERRVHKYSGALFRLNSERGPTRVMSFENEPCSMCYHPKTDVMVITFKKTSFILLYRLDFRTYRKEHDANPPPQIPKVNKHELEELEIPQIEINI